MKGGSTHGECRYGFLSMRLIDVEVKERFRMRQFTRNETEARFLGETDNAVQAAFRREDRLSYVTDPFSVRASSDCAVCVRLS